MHVSPCIQAPDVPRPAVDPRDVLAVTGFVVRDAKAAARLARRHFISLRRIEARRAVGVGG